jgi:fructuronate reductase
MQRLRPAALAHLPAHVGQPGYDRDALRCGVVHLGLGAFARAHLAVATEAAIEASGDLRWGIVGVSLQRPDTREALQPQQGLYTVAVRDAEANGRARQRLQVIGCVREVLVAPQDPRAVLERIAHGDTRIVSLSITEKAYRTEVLPPAAPPRGAIGFIVRGLGLRRARALGGLALMSLDNLPGNGARLQALVVEAAQAADPPLARWIERECTFPGSMVDRIVPRTTDADRAAVAAVLGVEDAWPVVAEPYFDWAVEDRFAAGRPDWRLGGARLVDEAGPWEQLKLRIVNGAHSSLAYLSAMAGWQTVHQAFGHASMARHVEALMRDEVEPTLPVLPGLDPAGYRNRLLQRWTNPALAHRTQQIAMDGSQKIPLRWLPPLRERLDAGAPVPRLALGVAAWMHYLRGHDEAGNAYPIDDPLAADLARLREQGDDALLGFAPVFGMLAGDERLKAAVRPALLSLREHGVRATLESMK